MEALMGSIGFSVCHQLTERCLNFGSTVMIICARCQGIYLGFLISAVIMFALYRKRQSGLPPAWAFIILAIFVASTFIDGFLSYLSITPTNNVIRFITGFLCGSSIMAVIYPVFVFQYYENTIPDKILDTPRHWLIYLGGLAAAVVITMARFEFMAAFFYYLTAFSVLFTFYMVNLVVALLVPRLSQKAGKLFSRYLIIPSLAALVLSGLELYVFFLLHKVTEQLTLKF